MFGEKSAGEANCQILSDHVVANVGLQREGKKKHQNDKTTISFLKAFADLLSHVSVKPSVTGHKIK